MGVNNVVADRPVVERATFDHDSRANALTTEPPSHPALYMYGGIHHPWRNSSTQSTSHLYSLKTDAANVSSVTYFFHVVQSACKEVVKITATVCTYDFMHAHCKYTETAHCDELIFVLVPWRFWHSDYF